jgi:putative oxidoreductase
VGGALVYSAIAAPGGTAVVPEVIGALAGVLLMAGLWTPVAGVVAGCAETWIAFSLPAHPWDCAILAVFAVTLALIGPGAWSIDARLFGRKHYAPPPL